MMPTRVIPAALLVLAGCEDRGGQVAPAGRVLQAGTPVAGVLVTIEGLPATVTDANGEFRLENPPASFVATARREHAGGRFEETRRQVSVGATLVLPAPLVLEPPTSTSTTITVTWTPSDSATFAEYQVYASASPAIDDQNGFHAFSTTDRATTTFTMTAVMGVPEPDFPMYFRVYAVDQDGARAGSNVRGATNTLWDTNTFDSVYDVSVEASWAGAELVDSVAWDGEAVWLLYRRALGVGPDDVVLPDLMTLERIDVDTRAVLHRLTLPSIPGEVHGLAWDGSQLWLGAYDFAMPARVLRVDPLTAEITRELVLPAVTGWVHGSEPRDLDWDGSHLLVTRRVSSPEVPGVGSSVIQRIDPVTGAALVQLQLPAALQEPSGIAYRDGQYWLAGGGASGWDGWTTVTRSGRLAVLDLQGRLVGLAPTTLLPGALVYAGDRLLLVSDNRVHTATVTVRDEQQ